MEGVAYQMLLGKTGVNQPKQANVPWELLRGGEILILSPNVLTSELISLISSFTVYFISLIFWEITWENIKINFGYRGTFHIKEGNIRAQGFSTEISCTIINALRYSRKEKDTWNIVCSTKNTQEPLFCMCKFKSHGGKWIGFPMSYFSLSRLGNSLEAEWGWHRAGNRFELLCPLTSPGHSAYWIVASLPWHRSNWHTHFPLPDSLCFQLFLDTILPTYWTLF